MENLTPEIILNGNLSKLHKEVLNDYPNLHLYVLNKMKEYGQQEFERGKKEEMMYWFELSNLEEELRIAIQQEHLSLLGLARVHGWNSDPELVEKCNKLRSDINKLKCRYNLPEPPQQGKGTEI